jgi:hypothetical protein
MVKYGILIGINYRNTADELYGCINDVSNVKMFLESKLGYTKFIVLTEDIPSRIPTKQNILRAIHSLVRVLKSGDEAWFHYSGHGILVYDRSGDEEDGYDSCISPLDYNRKGFISDDTLRSILVQKIPRGVKLYIVLDACHSGTGCDLRYKYDDFSILKDKNVKSSTYVPSEWSLRQTSYEFEEYATTEGEVYCISGCQDEQESADAFIEKDQMYGGALTSTMLSLFNSNDVKTYKWTDLLKDICCSLRINEYNQIPALTSGKPLYLESPIFSFPVRKPVNRPPKKNKKKYIQIANINVIATTNAVATMNANANIVNKLINRRMNKMIFA